MNRFIGTWKLENVIVKHGNIKLLPFGREVTGLLFYGKGYMSVQIMMPSNIPLEHMPEKKYKLKDLAWALKHLGYMGYYAKFELNEEKQEVIHHVEGSIVQSLLGRKEVRKYRFEDGLMILSAGPMELSWKRI